MDELGWEYNKFQIIWSLVILFRQTYENLFIFHLYLLSTFLVPTGIVHNANQMKAEDQGVSGKVLG